MKPIRILDIAAAVKGTLLWGDGGGVVNRVVTDSREAGEGALFVPIIGERVDAHRFIPDVMEKGAACTFSSDASVRGSNGAGILVGDTLRALQDFAEWYRSQFSMPIIGITGSVGKTTTKEMIADVMETKYRTLRTIRNLNSQVGVPLMMFHLEDDTEIAVFEMGISMPGEMDRLVEIARPQTAVMTNIGVSHIGNLGSREKICAEKGKIITNFPDNGMLYVCGNGDLKGLSAANIPYGRCRGRCETVYFGTEGENGKEIVENACAESASGGDDGTGKGFSYYGDGMETTADGQKFAFHYPGGETEVELSVVGVHHVNNAVVALALALQYGVPLTDAKRALKAYRPMDMRGVVREVGGVHIIDDTYNASPDSINSNLHALFDHGAAGEKIAVLADVLELGARSRELHEGIGRFIVEEIGRGRRLSLLVTVGREAGAIHDYVVSHSEIPAVHCADNAEAARVVRERMVAGDWVLVKGSRGMHMDEVVDALERQ